MFNELNKEVQIDEMIQPLIKAMNSLDWIITNSCCQGHPNGEFHTQFYVQFFCSMDKINFLSKILNKINRFIDRKHFPFLLNCDFNYDEQVCGCQSEAPQKSIALNLSLEEIEIDTPEDEKWDIIKQLTLEFSKLHTTK
jgi:hypothetical protein